MQKKIILWLVCLFLTSCGFHLRGVYCPHKQIYIQVIDKASQHTLVWYLKKFCIKKSQEDYTLIIHKANFRENITSISSSATPREYQLFFNILFELIDEDKNILIPPTTLTITRQLVINSDRILGSEEEKRIIKQEMRRDAAIQIYNRIHQLHCSRISS